MDEILLTVAIMAGGMGDNNYRVREEFTGALSTYNKQQEISWAVRMYTDFPCLEIARRMQRVDKEYYFIRPRHSNRLPRIDFYGGDTNDPDFMAVWQFVFSPIMNGCAPWTWQVPTADDEYMRYATAVYVELLFTRGWSRVKIQQKLDEMYQNELKNTTMQPPHNPYRRGIRLGGGHL
jgi:hypothetical protein